MPMRSFLLRFVVVLFGLTVPCAIHGQPNAGSQTVNVVVDTRDAGTPFPHFWEQIFGSGRAVLSLRESYRDDLRAVKRITDFDAIRFHGIFVGDVGL